MPHRIVILGGGFAGVYTARRLLQRARSAGVEIEVNLVNRENYMVFQPMLPEVISGSVGLADTVSPIRRLVPKARLHMRDVEAVDLAAKTVTCSPGFRPRPLVLEYDHLVIALGNVTDFPGMTGLAEHARPFKTLGDALALRNHVIHILEEADSERDEAMRKQMLTFVVGGGGFSGVEVCAELHDFVRRVLRSYPRLNPKDCRVVLLHSRDRILPEVDPSLALYAQNLLMKRGVEIMLNTRLAAATADHAVLGDGQRIPTKTLIATVPSHPNRVVQEIINTLGFTTKDAKGKERPLDKLPCDGTLLVKNTDNLWALGDCATIPLPGHTEEKPLLAPPTAQHAIREADVCADNILASIQKRDRRPFTFTGLGSLAALGHRRGVAQVFGCKVSGFAGWWLWRTVYLMKLPGLDRKIRVGLSWALDLIFPPDLVQLRIGRSSGVNQEHFEPMQTVFEQGDLGDRVYIIVKGKAEVIRTNNGVEEKLATLGPGQYFGEMALMKRAPRNATVRCAEAMDVLSIEKGDFNALFTHLTELRAGFEKVAAERQTVS